MAKSFVKKIRKHRMKILIVTIIIFILLVILGFALRPDKTWGPAVNDQQTESR